MDTRPARAAVVLQIDDQAEWRYLRGDVRPPPGWASTNFDASAWARGRPDARDESARVPAGLAGVGTDRPSVYLRREFRVTEPARTTRLILIVKHSGDFTVFLNGVAVAHGGAQGPPSGVVASTLAAVDGNSSGQVLSQVVDISSSARLLRTGKNVLAAEGHSRVPGEGPPVLVPALLGVEAGFTYDLVRYPYLQVSGPDGMTVVWATRDKGVPSVVYGPVGPSSNGQGTEGDGWATGTSTFVDALGGYYQHTVTLQGLMPGARYRYRPFLNGIELAPQDTLTFRAPPGPQDTAFTFIAFGDAGAGSPEQLALRDQFQQEDFGLVLVLGDVSQQRGTYSQYQANFFGIYRDALARAPFVPILGDDDYRTDSAAPFLSVFVLPGNAPQGQEERYFSFDYGNAHFVALDTEQVDATQAEWLKADLASTDRPWKIALMHRVPFGGGSRHSMAESTDIRTLFTPIFEAEGVDLVLGGNNHLYGRTAPITDARPGPPYGTITTVEAGGIVYVTSGAGGYPTLYHRFTDPFHQPPLGTSFSEHHYVRVEVQGCVLTLQAINSRGMVRDTFTLDRCGEVQD